MKQDRRLCQLSKRTLTSGSPLARFQPLNHSLYLSSFKTHVYRQTFAHTCEKQNPAPSTQQFSSSHTINGIHTSNAKKFTSINLRNRQKLDMKPYSSFVKTEKSSLTSPETWLNEMKGKPTLEDSSTVVVRRYLTISKVLQ